MYYKPLAMTPGKAAAYFTLAILSAAWFASAVGVPSSPRQVPTAPPSSDDARLDALARDVQAQGARLRKRLASAPEVQAPVRNPFTFGLRDSPRSAPARGVATAAAVVDFVPEPEPAPREPLLVLIGVAEEKTPDGLVRTAMISQDGEVLHMATSGDPVIGRYVVVTVSPDAVELKDLSTGLTRRLVLR